MASLKSLTHEKKQNPHILPLFSMSQSCHFSLGLFRALICRALSTIRKVVMAQERGWGRPGNRVFFDFFRCCCLLLLLFLLLYAYVLNAYAGRFVASGGEGGGEGEKRRCVRRRWRRRWFRTREEGQPIYRGLTSASIVTCCLYS